jgi:hypothetical protein
MELWKWLPLFSLGAVLEAALQICLKKGSSHHDQEKGLVYYLKLVRSPWIIAGSFTLSLILYIFYWPIFLFPLLIP